MKKALVIVNGIEVSYFLTDHAIAWAKREDSSLHVLFLVSGKELPEGYGFPSDIDLAQTENDISDSAADSRVIVRRQMELFRKMTETENISCQAELLIKPTLELVLEKAATAQLLMVAPDLDDVALQAVTCFNLQELIDRSPCPVEIVKEEK
jgi:hypothetical protein